MDSNNKNLDKAGKTYWNTTERNQEIDMRPFDPNRGGIRGFGKTVWHKAFQTALAEFAGGGKKLLELGCGGSAFLPYFSCEFGLQVDGIDYSERGCELARQMCHVNGIDAQVVCSDFFHPPPEMLEAYDVVASFGVVEHFTDTEKTLAQFAKFLRPGGVMITTVPNLDGMVGLAQRTLASDIFGKHVVIKRDFFHRAHENAGLAIVRCGYLLFTNFGVVNLGVDPPLPKKVALSALKAATGLVWALEFTVGALPPNRVSSPYLLCIARKPG
jgi:2-polyprenyl-3-methyl-5-hydroxy-6-metoxy-1,4-benzoquinol methylase